MSQSVWLQCWKSCWWAFKPILSIALKLNTSITLTYHDPKHKCMNNTNAHLNVKLQMSVSSGTSSQMIIFCHFNIHCTTRKLSQTWQNSSTGAFVDYLQKITHPVGSYGAYISCMHTMSIVQKEVSWDSSHTHTWLHTHTHTYTRLNK